jgi:hypothetical protein
MTTGKKTVAERDIEDLLPWYAAGTLNARDAERVAAAVANDAELARRLGLVRAELAETIHLNESLGAPSARAGDRLFAAIDAEAAPARANQRSFDFAGRISELLSVLSPRTLAWSAAAAALLLVVQAGVITDFLLKDRGGPGAYQTASAEQPRQVARQGSEVLVRFAPQATAADITKFLKAHDASLVDGPAGDLFRIRVAKTNLPKADLDRVVQAMQSERNIVVLVLPAGN